MPLTAAPGGTLFLDKYLWHNLHTHSTSSKLLLLRKHLSTSRRFSLSFAAEDRTICLYHNWSEQQHTLTGPFFTILWNFQIRSIKQFACLCCVSLHIFVCPLTSTWGKRLVLLIMLPSANFFSCEHCDFFLFLSGPFFLLLSHICIAFSLQATLFR